MTGLCSADRSQLLSIYSAGNRAKCLKYIFLFEAQNSPQREKLSPWMVVAVASTGKGLAEHPTQVWTIDLNFLSPLLLLVPPCEFGAVVAFDS